MTSTVEMKVLKYLIMVLLGFVVSTGGVCQIPSKPSDIMQPDLLIFVSDEMKILLLFSLGKYCYKMC